MYDKIILAYALWNFVVMLIYGIDKLLAKQNARRISEKALLSLAAVFGAVGAWLGMRLFHHKTRHAKFLYVVPILAFINLAVLFFALYRLDIR